MEPSRPEQEILLDRQRILEHVPLLPLAFSLGGRRANLVGALGGGLKLGDLIIVRDRQSSEDAPGSGLVGQVQSLTEAERPIGEIEATVEIPMSDGSTIRAARGAPTLRYVSGEVALLGRLTGDSFDPDVPPAGFEESLYEVASETVTKLVFDALRGDQPVIEVGDTIGHEVPAQLRSKGFARHTFLCGQSGSGKTYATGVLLEQLRLGTGLPIVVLDPNSDHIHLDELRDDRNDHPLAELYRSMANDVMVARGRGRGGRSLLAIDFSDLDLVAQTSLIGLDPVRDLEAYATFRELVGARVPRPYSAFDIIDAAVAAGGVTELELATRIENVGIGHWGVWCRPGEESLVNARPLQARCLVLDLGSLDLPEERLLVSGALLRWLWVRRDEKRPVLLVVDEAHNLFPAEPSGPAERATTELGISIAAEGRKYGLHLLVATQRPSKVHINVVSQCDNLALLRVNSVTDVEDLCRLFSHVPSGLIRQAPEFRQGEVLFAGPIAELPLHARIGTRLSPEGGGDIPTDWAG